MIKLNLQTFSEEVPPTTNEVPPITPSGEKEPEVKTFTQDEVNAIASKEAKKAQEKFLKSLGVENFDNAKEGLSKYKEWQESQKTESEKQAELLKNYETQTNDYKSQIENLNAQLSASKLGIKEESINDVVLLAKTLVDEDTDLNTAMSKILEKYPHFKGVDQQPTPEPGKPSFTAGAHKKEQPSEVDSWIQAFSKQIKK